MLAIGRDAESRVQNVADSRERPPNALEDLDAEMDERLGMKRY
jgi:hypothetical protein